METIRPENYCLADYIRATESLRNKTVEVTKTTGEVIVGTIVDIAGYGLIYVNGRILNPRIVKTIRAL